MIACLAVFSCAAAFDAGTIVMFPGTPQSVAVEAETHPSSFGAYFPYGGILTQMNTSLPLDYVTARVPSQCRRVFVSSDFGAVARLNQRTPEDYCYFFSNRPALIEFEVISNVSVPNQLHVESLDGQTPNLASRGYGKWYLEIEKSIFVRWSLTVPTNDRPEIRIRAIQRDNSFPHPGYKFWFDVSDKNVVFDTNQNTLPPEPAAPPSPTIQLKNYSSGWDQFTHEGYFAWISHLFDPWFIALVLTIALVVVFLKYRNNRNGQTVILNQREVDAIPPIVENRQPEVAGYGDFQQMPPPVPAPPPFGYFPEQQVQNYQVPQTQMPFTEVRYPRY